MTWTIDEPLPESFSTQQCPVSIGTSWPHSVLRPLSAVLAVGIAVLMRYHTIDIVTFLHTGFYTDSVCNVRTVRTVRSIPPVLHIQNTVEPTTPTFSSPREKTLRPPLLATLLAWLFDMTAI